MNSAVIVPVPAAEPVVGELRLRHDPSAAAGIPAHITLLFPFVPLEKITSTVLEPLEDIAGAIDRFVVRFSRVGRFPATLYLDPEPSGPFVSMTELIVGRFPSQPPYGGRFEHVVPHLTIADAADPETLDSVEKHVAPMLPITAEAREAWLMAQNESGRWDLVYSFPFRT